MTEDSSNATTGRVHRSRTTGEAARAAGRDAFAKSVIRAVRVPSADPDAPHLSALGKERHRKDAS